VAGARQLPSQQPAQKTGASDGDMHRGPWGGLIGLRRHLFFRRYEPDQVRGFGLAISARTATCASLPHPGACPHCRRAERDARTRDARSRGG
jgi:hypothetical protein